MSPWHATLTGSLAVRGGRAMKRETNDTALMGPGATCQQECERIVCVTECISEVVGGSVNEWSVGMHSSFA